MISFVVDASPYKQGKFLPGSHIPIVTEDELKNSNRISSLFFLEPERGNCKSIELC